MNTKTQTLEIVIEKNKVLRDTYKLLSATLFFSGLMAYLSLALNIAPFGILITLVGYFGLLFLTYKLKNSVWGILSVFALTGFMGLTLGPIINLYISNFTNGSQLVAMSMVGTATIFITLSLYAVITKKDFSGLANFLTVGIIVAFLAGLASIFFNIPALSLAVSSAFILLMSGLILYQTSAIINGGERSYILATVTLFVSIYNLFLSLLQILGVFSGED